MKIQPNKYLVRLKIINMYKRRKKPPFPVPARYTKAEELGRTELSQGLLLSIIN